MIFGVKKHVLDFEIIDNSSINTLIFVDASQYYKEPESPILQITLPGHDKYLIVPVNARHINVYNSNTLGITDSFNLRDIVSLPDGVWSITYRVCPYDEVYFHKFHLRTASLQSKVNSLIKNLDLSDCDTRSDDQFKRDIVDIFSAIESAKANTEEGNASKASDLYNIATSLVNKYSNKLNGVC